LRYREDRRYREVTILVDEFLLLDDALTIQDDLHLKGVSGGKDLDAVCPERGFIAFL